MKGNANCQKIKLQMKHWDKIFNGCKFATSRLGKRDFDLGRMIIEQTENQDISVMVDIKSIDYCRFDELTDYEAVAEGYSDSFELKTNLRAIYGDISDDSIITLLHWELPITRKMWLCDAKENHFVCPCCHEYALLDWAGAPVGSKYCPFCGTMLEPWDGKARYIKDKV